MKLLIDITGWTAMILILWAYFLITKEKVTAKSMLYQMLNFVGALLFVIYLSFQKAWPSVALNAIWGLIAFSAVIAINKRNKKSGNDGNDS
jgi:uncharacterized membrane protein YedE/YeeE